MLDQLLKAEIAWQPTLMLLVAYNLLYVLPFLLIPVALAILGEWSRARFRTISGWVDGAADWVMPKILVILGIELAADAVAYLAKGTGFL